MRIGELAGRAGVTAKTLRFYEQAGVLPAPGRTPAGYRDYDEAALDVLRFVRAAKAAGVIPPTEHNPPEDPGHERRETRRHPRWTRENGPTPSLSDTLRVRPG